MTTTPTRKDRYDVGDRVQLHVEPTHEGPHPDDQYAIAPVAIVREVQTHTYNDDWVVGYVVQLLDGEETIKPGSIARLAPDIVVHHFDEGTSEAYNRTQWNDVVRDGDVLVVTDMHARPDEDDDVTIGFLAGAWPVALHGPRGSFHALAADADISCLGKRPADSTTYTVHPDDGEPYETTYTIDADPGTDYTRSVELAQRELDKLADLESGAA